MESKIINLNKRLKELVDKNVQHYKTDCDHDINIMLKKDYGDVFYIYMRQSGTELMPEKFIYYKESTAYLLANYYKEENPLKVFKVHVTKRGRKILYGTIQNVNKTAFLNDIERNLKTTEKVKYLLELVDGKFIETIVPYSDQTYYHALANNKLMIDQIKSANIIEYIG